ncbi:MAG TPA: hypothetical protein PKC18_11785, partial [Lacipirellulaceae bacterium]|nr:hypothetical protein [Lacipirellulaceae bacterium]
MTEPTDSDVRSVLRRWLDDERPAELAPLTAAGSFSGAALWRVVAWNAPYVLRRWPRSMTPQRLAAIHGLQEALARGGAPVPPPLPVLPQSITVLVDRG